MGITVNPIEVRAVGEQSIWVLFADGVSGEINLSHLRGNGIFKKWDSAVPFSTVHINQKNHVIAWDDELEIDSDNIYLELIHKTFEEWQKEHEMIYAAN